MSVWCISRGSLQFFAPGWWWEGPFLMCSRSYIPSCCLPPWRKGDQCPPKRIVGWSFGRWKKVHSVLLEDQTWTPSLSSKIALCPRDPWNFAGSLQEGESPAGHCPTLPHRLWNGRWGLGHAALNTMLWKWGRQPGTWKRDSLNSAQLEKSLIPSQLETS